MASITAAPTSTPIPTAALPAEVEKKVEEARVKWYDIALTKSTKHEIKSYFVEAETGSNPDIDQKDYLSFTTAIKD